MEYTEIAKKYFKIAKELHDASCAKIRELMEGTEIVLLTADELYKYDLDPICVTNDFSLELVLSIAHDADNEFVIETESGPTYLSAMQACEVYELAYLLDAYFDAVKAK